MMAPENPRRWGRGLALVGMLVYGLAIGAYLGWHFGARSGAREAWDDANWDIRESRRSEQEAKARLDESRSMVGLCADALNACVRGHEEGDAP